MARTSPPNFSGSILPLRPVTTSLWQTPLVSRHFVMVLTIYKYYLISPNWTPRNFFRSHEGYFSLKIQLHYAICVWYSNGKQLKLSAVCSVAVHCRRLALCCIHAACTGSLQMRFIYCVTVCSYLTYRYRTRLFVGFNLNYKNER